MVYGCLYNHEPHQLVWKKGYIEKNIMIPDLITII